MPRRIATGAFFKQTALAVLDASLSEVLGWTWFLARPEEGGAAIFSHGSDLLPEAVGAQSRFRASERLQVCAAALSRKRVNARLPMP